MENREKLKLVVTGHVDHGKSTVIGRLLFDTGSLPQGTVDRVKRISAETGQPFEFAYLLDAFEEEQKQGITIDTTQLQFHSAKRDYVIIDAPGHKEFLKNMISGASDAEAAFLVVDAERGVEEQSKRHAHMLSLLGIRQIGLIVNKMDLIKYNKTVFELIKMELENFLANLGLTAGCCLPLSALVGENILLPSEKLSWFEGPTLIEALDGLRKDGAEGGELRFPVQDVYKFDDRRIIAGKLENGSISVGDEILISPGGKKTTVASMAYWLEKDKKDSATVGESIGITVTDEFFNRRGEVISKIDTPPIITDSFKASLFWMGKNSLKTHRKYKLKLATQETEAEVVKIVSLIDSSTLAAKESSEVGFNEVAEVLIRSRQTLALDLFSTHRATGRFVLVDGYDVAGGGIIIEAENRLTNRTGFINGHIKARCEVFDEYFYSVEDYAISKIETKQPQYTIGDAVPLTGNSYEYPGFFDIVIFRDQVAVSIRNGRITEIKKLEEFEYEGFPVVNGRGFSIKLHSKADWTEVKKNLNSIDSDREATLGQRWLDFNTYRKIPITSNKWVI